MHEEHKIKKNNKILSDFIPTNTLIENAKMDNDLISTFVPGHAFSKIKDSLILKNDYYIFSKLFSDTQDHEYRLNKNFYRTNNFKKNIDGQSILFSGCSFTFGVGLPENLIWTSMLADKLNIDKENMFNIGVGGASIHSTIKDIMLFIRKYGKPKKIFILFPEVSRDLIYRVFNKDNIDIVQNVLYRSNYLEESEDNAKKYILNYVHENNILRYSTMIGIFEEFCKESGIDLLWSTTIKYDYDTFKLLNFKYIAKNFVDFLDVYRNNSKNIENVHNLPFWDVADDGQHPGTAYHYLLSESFFKEINENN
jgi:hypothetical protein